MSREIKFRAWDYVLKEMSVPFYPYYAREFMPPPLLEYCGQDIELLEFTGLQDKNGVDIYEGDIDTEGYVFEFNTDMGGWYRMKNGEGFQWYAQALRKGRLPFEIAGNIYESPELLEDKP